MTGPTSDTDVPGAAAPGRDEDDAVGADAGGEDDAVGVDVVGRLSGGEAEDRVPRSARVLVAVLFVLLLVPGLVGFDAWPLTGWRLFSLSRDADQTRWVLEARDPEGERRIVSLEELPLRYRHAEWPMADLPGASEARRDAVCMALYDAVVEVHPETVTLALARDHTRLVERDGEWITEHDIEEFHTCPGGRDIEGPTP